MNEPPPVQVSVAGLLVLIALGASAAVCFRVVERWRHGLPVAPFQRRRPVPWHAVDVLLVALVYLLAIFGAGAILAAVLGAQRQPAAQADTTTVHPIAQLAANGNLWMAVLATLVAVVVAPVTEEFLFRLVLQGWIEGALWRNRRGLPRWLRRIRLLPVLVVSSLFAAMHFRIGAPAKAPTYLVAVMIANAGATLLTMAFAIALLRLGRGATAVDLGWDVKKFRNDVRLGLVTFVGLGPPLYLIQVDLHYLLPPDLAPDPITLFILALVLGTLYYRTHRLAPSVTLHAALNGTSMAMVLLFGK